MGCLERGRGACGDREELWKRNACVQSAIPPFAPLTCAKGGMHREGTPVSSYRIKRLREKPRRRGKSQENLPRGLKSRRIFAGFNVRAEARTLHARSFSAACTAGPFKTASFPQPVLTGCRA